MYSLSQQDTSRDNRLNMLVESRVRREVQARFGGEFLETYRRNTARHRVLSLRLTAQYLVLFVAGLLGVFVCFAGMYMSGVPQGLCILFALTAGLAVTGGTFYLNRRFGPHGRPCRHGRHLLPEPPFRPLRTSKAHGLAPASAAHHPSSGHPAAATHSYPSNRKTVILCAEP